jgi:hypothetical protein
VFKNKILISTHNVSVYRVLRPTETGMNGKERTGDMRNQWSSKMRNHCRNIFNHDAKTNVYGSPLHSAMARGESHAFIIIKLIKIYENWISFARPYMCVCTVHFLCCPLHFFWFISSIKANGLSIMCLRFALHVRLIRKNMLITGPLNKNNVLEGTP